MADPNARDTKLIQYLNEAYGKEKELETALQAHIAMTTKAPYKKRLQQHLKETKGHAREVQRRIKQLGGKAEAGPISAPGRRRRGSHRADRRSPARPSPRPRGRCTRCAARARPRRC